MTDMTLSASELREQVLARMSQARAEDEANAANGGRRRVESMETVSYKETKQFLYAMGLASRKVVDAPNKFFLKEYAEKEGIDLGPLLDVSFRERSGYAIARLGGVDVAVAALDAATTPDGAVPDEVSAARAAKILANVAGQLPCGARAAALAAAGEALAAAAATPPGRCRTTRRAAVGALLLLSCDNGARAALERARAPDALRAAANADDAGDDKTHGLVTRALHRLGALRPAVVAAAAL